MKPEELGRYHIRSYDEIYERIKHKLETTPSPSDRPGSSRNVARNILLTKLGSVYNVLISEYDKMIEALNKIDQLHSFYREVFRIETGKYPYEYLSMVKKLKNITRKIYGEYREKLRETREKWLLKNIFRSGVGRLLSIYRRNERKIIELKNALIELSKLPDVSGDYVVIIAGMPQVGKSTLLSKLTKAKPLISPFPFTTKTVIVGHINLEPYGKITLIDTPGILDRPVDERNVIELKAVLAIKYLADLVLCLFDASKQSYYSLDEQFNVYYSIRQLVGDEKVLPVINKIDLMNENELQEILKIFVEKTGVKPLTISAYLELGLSDLKNMLYTKFMEKTRLHQQ